MNKLIAIDDEVVNKLSHIAIDKKISFTKITNDCLRQFLSQKEVIIKLPNKTITFNPETKIVFDLGLDEPLLLEDFIKLINDRFDGIMYLKYIKITDFFQSLVLEYDQAGN
jgi:hypothetical protein